MSHFALTLQQFLQPAPACDLNISLEALESLFATQPNEIAIVVGEGQNPLGAIALRTLLPYLARQRQGCFNPARGSLSAIDREAPTPFDARSLLIPIASFPATTRIKDFLSYLQAGQLEARDLRQCALVDESGCYQGLLDSGRLFSSLLPAFAGLEALPSGKTCSPTRAALLQLLDRLPLPIVLQTVGDEIRYPNRAWREQIGEAGESPRSPRTATPYPFYSWCNLTQEADLASASAWSGNPYPHDNSLQERAPVTKTWQFIKLPLEVAGEWDLERLRGGADSSVVNLQTPISLILAADITEQRQLCKELAAKNADLVQLNRLKDEFLACISHELKTPLTAVLGLSSLLKDRKLGELTPRQERYANLIHQSGRQLMSVVNDLLDLTRIEAGQLKLNVEPIKIEEICRRAYEQSRSHLHRKTDDETAAEVEFTLEIEPGLKTLIADELRLRQMLVHLLDNALKFTPLGGEIGLEVSRWQGWIEFTVWDTGIGIPEDFQHLIFQKFQQLESPLTRQFEGTGLGLVLTQRLARAHGGDISFISKAGEGSQFTLLLPPSPPGERATRVVASSARNFKTALPPSLLVPPNPLILIVESALPAIEQLNNRLQNLGYRVAIARSGTEALEKARGLQPRAIFLSPILPLLSGWDVLTLLKSDEKTRHIPVAVAATLGEKELALRNGADGFLALPPEKAALQELLYRLDESDRARAPGSATRSRGVTILRLNPEGSRLDEETARLTAEFDRALLARSSKLNYRILATDDLEQAEILARVWHPEVVLLDGFSLEDPGTYLRSLKSYDRLAGLPLVTLDAKITEAANQVGGLLVFPCLVPADSQGVAALLQVIQIAMGLSQQPRISILGNWPCDRGVKCEPSSFSRENPEGCARSRGRLLRSEATLVREKRFSTCERLQEAGEIEFLQAFVQYLEKAGLKCFQTCAWSEIYSQIQHQGIDLLLLYLGQPETAPTGPGKGDGEFLLQELQQLSQLPVKPPVLVLDRRRRAQVDAEVELNALLEEVATYILQGRSYSCVDLLEQIHQLLPG